MQSTTGKLVEHLAEKEMQLSQIAVYVGELGSMIAEEPSIPIHEMERAMRDREWRGFVLDDRTYFLTLLIVVETLSETGPETGSWFERSANIRWILN